MNGYPSLGWARHEATVRTFRRAVPTLGPLLPGKPGDPGFVAADLWIARTGAPGETCPSGSGPFNSVHKRFYRWARKGTWKQVFDELQDPDLEWLLIDATIIRAHQHAAGAEASTAEDEALGRSRGGFSSKIPVAADGLVNPVRVVLSPGQAGDRTFAPELVADLEAGAVVGDKGYDSDAFVKSIEASGGAGRDPAEEEPGGETRV